MANNNTKLGEYFVRLPKCNENGTNYIMYRDRFKFAAAAAGLEDHLDLLKMQPSMPVPPQPAQAPVEAAADDNQDGEATQPAPQLTDEQRREYGNALRGYAKAMDDWKSGEAIVKQGIAQSIPDSLFLKVKDEETAAKMWAKVRDEFEKKSRMMVVDLRRKMQEERCAEGQDVKEHLTKLQKYREDLTAMGARPSDEDFIAIIMGSLPVSFDPYIAALSATSSYMPTPLSPDTYIRGISDEYN
jgi:hypothetical protein